MEAIVAHDIIGSGRDYVTPAVLRIGNDDTPPTVFIIDGDIAVRQSLERLIRTAGWEPETFASAEEFLSHPRGTVPSCVILDLTLPGIERSRIATAARRTPEHAAHFCHLPYRRPDGGPGDESRRGRFLIRPIDDMALLSAIGAAIERSRAALRHDSEMRMLRDYTRH